MNSCQQGIDRIAATHSSLSRLRSEGSFAALLQLTSHCINRRPILQLYVISVVLMMLTFSASNSFASPIARWVDAAESAIPATGQRFIHPDRYRTAAVDFAALSQILDGAPMEGAAMEAPLLLELPLPDGSTRIFRVVESPILAPELGMRYPEIRTYLGRLAAESGVTARLDRTPQGFHAMIFMGEGTAYIDPYQQGDTSHYLVYWQRDARPADQSFCCQVTDAGRAAEEMGTPMGTDMENAHGTQLRTYRAAIAATGEYTALCGGTVPLGLAAVTTVLNRVTGIYEREVSVRMQLVPNNHFIIYTNAATDPYTNSSGGTMLGQNQANLDAVIGSANYDIGHVFSTSGGGVASLGVVCRAGLKARGETGREPPVGDHFSLVVAHEMGHQYGANHTSNGNEGACAGGHPTAYEPGSGSTLMSNAGLCGSQNLQLFMDDYFHWNSIQEIINYTTLGAGNSCPAIASTGAVIPAVTAPAGGFTIPINTPFALSASAATVGTPTYCWEESDLGPAGPPQTPSGNAPIFRSFPPTASPMRVFPQLSDILDNTSTIGEILPSYTRDLSFKVTVRDAQAGGVGVDNASIAFAVTGSAGPFQITSPNTTGIVWPFGSTQAVTWDVANTSAAPVNCHTVNILLSTDGGMDFDSVLAAGTANDGAESVVVPNTATLAARIKVEAADHVFFDINNSNFQINESAGVGEPPQSARAAAAILHAGRPNPFSRETAIAFEVSSAARVTLGVYDLRGHLVRMLLDGPVSAGRHETFWNGTDARGVAVASGVYLCELKGSSGHATQRVTILK